MIIRGFAHVISVVFHPLFIPTYLLLVAILANPSTFRFIDNDPVIMLVTVIVNTIVLPAAAIGIMRPLGFVKSFQMAERTDRIIPFVAGLFFYIWTVVVFVKQGNSPVLFTAPLAGTLAAMILAFLINVLFIKISLHALSMGVAVGYFIAIIPLAEQNLLPLLIGTILLAGLVGTARLVLRAHVHDEIYLGYLIGMVGQMIALHLLL